MAKSKTTKFPEGELPFSDGVNASGLPTTQLAMVPAAPQVPERLYWEPQEPRIEADQVSTRYPWGWESRDESQVASSWRRQAVIIDTEAGVVRLQACLDEDGFGAVSGDQCADRGTSATTAASAAHWPLTGELIIVGSIPGPIPSLSGEATARLAALRGQLARYHVATLPANLVDRSHSWTEPALIAVGYIGDPDVTGDWQERVLGRARSYGFDHAVRVMGGRWQVLDLTDPLAVVESDDQCSVTRDDMHRCPLLRSPADLEYCRMHGGPWTSSSIHAATGWKRHRDSLIEVLGCDTCHGKSYSLGGQILTEGGPVGLSEAPLPTRWLAPDDTRFKGVEVMNE